MRERRGLGSTPKSQDQLSALLLNTSGVLDKQPSLSLEPVFSFVK